MTTLWKSKKGFNDMFIITVIILVLFGFSTFISLTNGTFGTEYSEFDTNNNLEQAREESENANQLSLFNVLINTLKLSLWDVGDTLGLPIWLDIFFSVMALVLILTIARNIWIGGGA